MNHLPDDQRCTYTTRDARRCRAARAANEAVCFFHLERAAKETKQRAAKERAMLQNYFQGTAAAELFPSSHITALESAHGVNRFIAGVARLVAEGRLDPRIACSLGYLAQIMLTTIPYIERERDRTITEQVTLSAAERAPAHPLFGADPAAQLHKLIKSIDDSVIIEPFHLDPESDSASAPTEAD